MAKKGERVGAMGDTVYYRTPDGQIIDDAGNVLKGPMAKMLADEYESKQQEKAKAQAEAKAAAEEDKRKKAAEKSAEIARKSAERQAASDAKRQQADEERAQKAAEREATQKTQQPKQPAAAPRQPSAPRQAAPKQPAAAAPEPTDGQTIKNAFKNAAISVGKSAFKSAFPTLSGAINRPDPVQGNSSAEDINAGGARQAINRVADSVNTTNMMMQTSIARQEMTNQILQEILKEVQVIRQSTASSGILDALSNLIPGVGGGGVKGKPAPGKVTPKTSMLGKAGNVMRGVAGRAGGALLGGAFQAYDEYQESGDATRAASAGAGGAVGGGLGAWGGAAAGGAIGALGGPLAPVTVPLGMLIGGIAGGIGGSMLGGKAGKATYDAVTKPSVPPPPAVGEPKASISIKEAQNAAKQEPEPEEENPLDAIVNVKTLTFNADSIIFNAKNQQAASPTAAPTSTATPEVKAAGAIIAAGSGSRPSPSSQGISGPTQSGSIREALASAQTPSLSGFGTSQINAARANAATSPFSVTPGAMSAGPQSASLGGAGGAGVGGASDASAVQLASTMVGKNRVQSLDYLKAGGFNNTGEAWCAEFVNSTLKQTGGTGTGDKIANSFQKWGTSIDPTKVQAGDVVLQTKGNGPGQVGGHVGIATGVYQHGQIEMIAGNSGKAGSVRKYFVPINGQLQVRRGSGGSGNNPKVADATKNPSAGNAAGAATAGASDPKKAEAAATPGAKQTAAAGGWSDAAKTSAEKTPSAAGDPTSRRFDAEGNKLDPAPGGGIKRFDPTTGKFEEPSKPDNSDPYLRKIKPKGMAEGLTDAAIKRAKESAAQAAEIVGPKTFNVGTGRWEAYELAKQPSYEPAKISEPKPITKGAELNRASTQDIVDDRSAKTGITVNQQSSATPPINNSSKGNSDSTSVGMVEPVDARTRLKDLFGISTMAA